MSNKQNDVIYDNITEIPGLDSLIELINEELMETPMGLYEMTKLSGWLLAHDLEMLEFSKKTALKALKNLTKELS